MQAPPMWGLGGVPQRTKWGLGADVDLTIRTAHLEHGYAWQTDP